MSTQEFIELLKKPETIANYSLDELRELSHKFSYSQPLQVLYAMRLKYSSQHLFDRQLGKVSILTNDRKVLFELFEETTQVPAPSEQINLEDYPEESPQDFEEMEVGASAERAIEPAEETTPIEPEPSQPAKAAEKEEPPQEEIETASEIEAKEEEPVQEEQIEAQNTVEETAETEKPEEETAMATEHKEEPKAEEPGKGEESKEKSSAKAVMSDRIREILEKNRRMREEALARKEGRSLPKEDEKEETAVQATTEESKPEEVEATEEPSAAGQPDAEATEPVEQPEIKDEPEIHSAEEPPQELEEEETLEGQSLVDEPQRSEAQQTTNDFIDEELSYERQEGYETPATRIENKEEEEEPESTLEGEVQQEEHESRPVENTTNDFTEEETEEEPASIPVSLTSLEERIAGIRSRLEQLGSAREDKSTTEAEEDKNALADALDDEYLDIQSRSERIHAASFEPGEEEETQEEEETHEEQEEEADEFEPISNKEAQQMSFSRWLRQFEQKEEQIDAQTNEEKVEEQTEDQLEKASLKFEDKMQLLDSFVEKLPDLKKRKPLISNPPPKMNYEEVQGEEEQEEDNSSSLVTETLAKVYIKQKHYKKAIQAYEILRLKYPEKSSLFADRISEIKKLENSK